MSSIDSKKLKYLKAKSEYYNSTSGKSFLSDKEFDLLEQEITKSDPEWVGLLPGYGVKNKKTKSPLEFPMFSLDKVDNTSAEKWLSKLRTESVLVSDKLDGSSVQLIYNKGKPVSLKTRGNGKIGGDISFLISHLKIPKKISELGKVVLRAEALFSLSKFSKYKKEFDAARNAASGLLNRKDPHPGLKDLDLIILKVLSPSMTPSKGLTWAKTKGFKTVAFKKLDKDRLSNQLLDKLLKTRKANSVFELDGLVIEEDVYKKTSTTGNPDNAVKFKERLDAADAPVATVLRVIWEVSTHGYLVPRVEVEPMKFGGATIRFASGYNAKFVIDNKIEKGAKVSLVRSGDIIPKILGIIKPSKIVPTPVGFGDYAFDKTKVNYILIDPKSSDTVRIKRIEKFFTTLEIDFVGPGIVGKLYENGFTNLRKIVKASKEDFLKLPGIKETLANKLYDSLHTKIDKGVDIVLLCDASSAFPRGIGETRLRIVDKTYPLSRLLPESKEDIINKVAKLPGFSSITARQVASGSSLFLRWAEIVGIKSIQTKYIAQKGALSGLNFSFTGYRDKVEESEIIDNGGLVVPFSNRTNFLLIRPSGGTSSKVDSAKEKGIKVTTWDRIKTKYELS